jgi:hypothetical protein
MSTPLGLPPIFEKSNVAIVPNNIVAEFPINTFLESIAIDLDNTLFISSHLDGKIWRIGNDNIPTVFATIAGKATGLTFTTDRRLLLTGWDDHNLPTVFAISPQGEAEVLVTMPDAIFLNGLTPFNEERYLIADSYRGAIWELNIATKNTKIWLEHPDLARSSDSKEFPAANGIKINDNFVYVSNTEKMQIVRIEIDGDDRAVNPEIWLENVNLDDFAFDFRGDLYGTTHIYNSVVRITTDGNVTTIATAAEGVVGSTALAFGKVDADDTGIYVVTNGGMSYPPPTGLETAKVVRLEVGIRGLSLFG